MYVMWRLKDDQRVAIQFDRNGRAREPQDGSTYLLRIAGQFINVGRDFSTAITRLHQEQARLADGVPRKEATDLSTPTVCKPAVPGRIRIAGGILPTLSLIGCVYVILALLYWFRDPAIGTAICTGCFALAWILSLS